MFPIKRTVFFTSVTVHKNTVRLIGNIEYSLKVFTIRDYRFVIYWLMDLPVVGYYGGFTYKHPITML